MQTHIISFVVFPLLPISESGSVRVCMEWDGSVHRAYVYVRDRRHKVNPLQK